MGRSFFPVCFSKNILLFPRFYREPRSSNAFASQWTHEYVHTTPRRLTGLCRSSRFRKLKSRVCLRLPLPLRPPSFCLQCHREVRDTRLRFLTRLITAAFALSLHGTRFCTHYPPIAHPFFTSLPCIISLVTILSVVIALVVPD